ncbi:unnamed protein product [Psylliodes chrysocephalus]|uniref:Uncharacterized protein n=1 Tax=Psylliodes chrysocephalus TaxID=3402493 RepID=A0A9P0D3K7_9CUCU|nr:unnamed protein product [Psylliodes chrysocephala]
MPPTRNQMKGEDELHSIIKNLVIKLCTSDDFISQVTQTITNIIEEKYNKQFNEIIQKNHEINEKLQKQEDIIKNLVEQQNKQKGVGRSRNIRVYGVTESTENENVRKIITNIFTKQMKLKLKDDSMEFCYRLGKTETNKNRTIMVRFSTNYYKNLVYNNKKLLKSIKVVIKEDLTKDQLNMEQEATKKVGDKGKVWTISGKIFLKLDNQQRVIRIENQDNINKLSV